MGSDEWRGEEREAKNRSAWSVCGTGPGVGKTNSVKVSRECSSTFVPNFGSMKTNTRSWPPTVRGPTEMCQSLPF